MSFAAAAAAVVAVVGAVGAAAAVSPVDTAASPDDGVALAVEIAQGYELFAVLQAA